jgi:antitoxin YefM
MKTVNFSELRTDLRTNLNLVCENHEVLIVHRPKGKSVVMLSLDEYNSLQETRYLLKTNENRKRLERSVAAIMKGENLIRKEFLELNTDNG